MRTGGFQSLYGPYIREFRLTYPAEFEVPGKAPGSLIIPDMEWRREISRPDGRGIVRLQVEVRRGALAQAVSHRSALISIGIRHERAAE